MKKLTDKNILHYYRGNIPDEELTKELHAEMICDAVAQLLNKMDCKVTVNWFYDELKRYHSLRVDLEQIK